jgi:hypothetical protein
LVSIKKRSIFGIKGLAPACCLPLWGREWVNIAIPLSMSWEGFLQSLIHRSGLEKKKNPPESFDLEWESRHPVFPDYFLPDIPG